MVSGDAPPMEQTKYPSLKNVCSFQLCGPLAQECFHSKLKHFYKKRLVLH